MEFLIFGLFAIGLLFYAFTRDSPNSKILDLRFKQMIQRDIENMKRVRE